MRRWHSRVERRNIRILCSLRLISYAAAAATVMIGDESSTLIRPVSWMIVVSRSKSWFGLACAVTGGSQKEEAVAGLMSFSRRYPRWPLADTLSRVDAG